MQYQLVLLSAGAGPLGLPGSQEAFFTASTTLPEPFMAPIWA